MNEKILKIIKKMPDKPGVYFFLGRPKTLGKGSKKRNNIIYIGKATSLKSRARSYFSSDILDSRGPLIKEMVDIADGLGFLETDSVLEALILEASLIKKYQPKYNTKEKDNKSFNYIVIIEEKFPRVLVVRGREIDFENKIFNDFKIRSYFGPFPNGQLIKEALRIIRKVFPFRDKCKIGNVSNRGCFNFQIGLCPGVCNGKISENDYLKNIRNIFLFLDGKKKKILENFEKEMMSLAKKEKFEEADILKKKIFALKHIQDISLLKRDYKKSEINDLVQEKEDNSKIFRIEAYDSAHLSGSLAVGVMTVLENGEIRKNEYRKFKIRNLKNKDDLANLKEILERRLGRSEWRLPNVIVIDGGMNQVNVAKDVLKNKGFNIDIVSVIKDSHHKPSYFIGEKGIVENHKNEILLANSESHRFALTYHKNLRKLQ